MNYFEQTLEKYAELAVKVGINIQPGQTLVVNAPLEAAPLTRLISKKAYEAGAKHVHIDFNDDELTQIRFKYAPDEAFTEAPLWKIKGLEELAENGASFMSIYAPNPDLFAEVDPQRIATWNKTQGMAMQKYRSYVMADKNAWTVMSVPTAAWAKKVFPHLEENEAIESLWNAIFEATRSTLENPVEAWNEHNETLAKMEQHLNAKAYDKLIFTAPGTHLEVTLPENHVWKGGSAHTPNGTVFNPNMPTEEVFTMPHKDGVNGTVRSTKPLVYAGQLIDQFSLTFKDGSVVDFTAEVGYEALKNLLNTDEGARRLGEVALVAHDSPISNSNLVFYNTLYDENASCHLAFGKAYPTNVKNGENMTSEQLAEAGVNDSLVHVDYMIGSADMDIDGVTKDGNVEPIFREGNWVI